MPIYNGLSLGSYLGNESDHYIIVDKSLFDDLLRCLDPDKREEILSKARVTNKNPIGPVQHSDFGKQLRLRRKANQITQTQLANESGLKQPDVSDIELGQEGYTEERKLRLVHALERLIKR